jgi:hypothetical protein
MCSIVVQRTHEAAGQHAAPQVLDELSLDVTGQSATFEIAARTSASIVCTCRATHSCSTVRSGSRCR